MAILHLLCDGDRYGLYSQMRAICSIATQPAVHIGEAAKFILHFCIRIFGFSAFSSHFIHGEICLQHSDVMVLC